MNTRFACNGCGKCCNDHHVPLTLQEAKAWATDGGQLIILVEGFLDNGYGVPVNQREHVQRRSLPVRCGNTQAYVSITFAAYNVGPCRNLDDSNRCSIYERRPLVCRIYPMEINPHIPLRPDLKDCAPETWQSGPELIHGGRLMDTELAALIERSRQADREEVGAKAEICRLLGIRTMALKGDGYTVFLPDLGAFLNAVDQVEASPEQPWPPLEEEEWSMQVSSDDLASQLEETGAMIASALENIGFISLSKVS
ncbi:YkgJ family cysteine cluster protein [Pseudomonas luteola]|uniref:YkgJ family cysteine cluster protein n=1 Tax=Pseudomonas luteola TaxID=47886 RepID=UPI00123B34BF|nr:MULTISPECIES: YkgJ family cysteine cluster protein [Pseudomonas]MBA1248651.1 YkgJ family cysteine cluster protein [Pseudomonas zeshuii]QEU27804.1 YkgJ family cysteine cluster protein [Pseudomonas luteola]